MRASLALAHLEPNSAIQSLQIAMPYEFGTPRSSVHGNFGALYPAYLRGEARLAAHQPEEAKVEFQKILDHSGIVASDPIGALAHLQLGRSYSMLGDRTKARAAYEDFLHLWDTADAEIPILVEAKKEYAGLL